MIKLLLFKITERNNDEQDHGDNHQNPKPREEFTIS